MKKKIVGLLILLILAITGSTCRKKISRYPLDMYGMWVSKEGSFCDYMFIEIERNNVGSYGTNSGHKGCSSKKWQGRVTFNKNHLYIGYTKLKFIKKPSLSESNDSIVSHSPSPNGTFKIIAKMTVQLSRFHDNPTYTFNKIIDY